MGTYEEKRTFSERDRTRVTKREQAGTRTRTRETEKGKKEVQQGVSENGQERKDR